MVSGIAEGETIGLLANGVLIEVAVAAGLSAEEAALALAEAIAAEPALFPLGAVATATGAEVVVSNAELTGLSSNDLGLSLVEVGIPAVPVLSPVGVVVLIGLLFAVCRRSVQMFSYFRLPITG